FHPQYQVDVLVDVMLGERIDEGGKAPLIFEQGGDVVKENAFFGEIGDFANQIFQAVTIDSRWVRHLPGSFNAECSKTGNRPCFRFLNIIDARRTRTLLQTGTQPGQLIASPGGQHFDAAIRVVAHPSGDAQDVRLAFDKPAETDTLDTTANDKTPSFVRFFGCAHE